MLELASLGAQVMHSRSIELAQNCRCRNILRVFMWEIKWYVYKGWRRMLRRREEKVITGLATSNDVVILTIKDFSLDKVSSLFECIASKNISVDMISQTAPIGDIVNVSFTISKRRFK